ncbi:hypothetical protein UFOVP238_34 [uncultured Caudovirales phage]|uniref:Uncharacterized protein n=1 Tax=uncultured Caudovirales phage TaxID=2100421 RepID=A0A6J7WQS2_9CAUD|nr:hypothetical protein UFOVP238_34 [uncultured Caudovirales phage]
MVAQVSIPFSTGGLLEPLCPRAKRIALKPLKSSIVTNVTFIAVTYVTPPY